jgi:hypothetical protein
MDMSLTGIRREVLEGKGMVARGASWSLMQRELGIVTS